MSFITQFKKETRKMEGVLIDNKLPTFWIDTGNHVINKIISGSYKRGYPQGRLAAIVGPSGSGKSFLVGNSIKSAQDQGCGILIIDSEHALDEDYLMKLGVDVNAENFLYRGVKTIAQASEIISKFLKAYRQSGTTDKFFIAIDSIDMLLTDSMMETYEKGDIGNDQGQHAKQIKRMLATFMHDIKDLNIIMLCTKQPYKEQDLIKARLNPYVVTDSFQFAFSQILMITKLLLKDEKTKEQTGITMKTYGYKTRFTKPFQQCKIEVPYETGMDKYSGLLDAAISQKIVEKNGAWNVYKDNKFYEKNFSEHAESILKELSNLEDSVLDVHIEEKEDIEGMSVASILKEKRLKSKD